MAMASEGSITHCIQLLKAGERTAAQQLWERYFQRLVGLARAHLQGTPRRAADEEDVALSAFESVYQRAERGQFPRLDDRDDLWQLLAVVTVRKAIDLVRHEGRPTRGSGRVLVLSELVGPGLEQVLDPELTPELAAQMAEECRRLYRCLGDDTLRAVARWKMEGHSNAEIAAKLGCVPQTVERKLRAIRRLWAKEVPD
jgi:DNA-directed RNA polymerase specialized sigma24 family protein